MQESNPHCDRTLQYKTAQPSKRSQNVFKTWKKVSEEQDWAVQRGSCNKSLSGGLTDFYGFAPLSRHNRSWLDTESPEPSVIPLKCRYSYKLTQRCCDNRASSVSHLIARGVRRTKDGKLAT